MEPSPEILACEEKATAIPQNTLADPIYKQNEYYSTLESSLNEFVCLKDLCVYVH